MAVKALFQIMVCEPQTVNAWRLRLNIWAGYNSAVNVLNDEDFALGALSTTINASLRNFVEDYIQDQWDVPFNPLLDSVKCVNPVSLL